MIVVCDCIVRKVAEGPVQLYLALFVIIFGTAIAVSITKASGRTLSLKHVLAS